MIKQITYQIQCFCEYRDGTKDCSECQLWCCVAHVELRRSKLNLNKRLPL